MNGLRLAHVGIHQSLNRNAGDTLLFEEVRRLIESHIDVSEWVPVQVWEKFDEETARSLSEEVDGIVIGGGGLILRDQAGSDTTLSGWQWNASEDAIRAITVPLVVFAIGYNRFRGHPEFPEVFRSNINTLAEKASFFGLRNTGSMKAVGSYLPDSLAERLQLQPCPTVFLWQLEQELREVAERHDAAGEQVLRVNVAFDRVGHRFGDDPESVLQSMARAVAQARRSGWSIRVTCHKDDDHRILPALDREGCTYEVDDLTNSDASGILKAYARCDAVLGARGHAQMIPFGLRRPIVSLISHDKMAWFLDDVGHPEWGVEVLDEAMSERITEQLDLIAADRALRLGELAESQERMWSATRKNLRRISSIFESGSLAAPVVEVES